MEERDVYLQIEVELERVPAKRLLYVGLDSVVKNALIRESLTV